MNRLAWRSSLAVATVLIGLGAVIGSSPAPWIVVPAVLVWCAVLVLRMGLRAIVKWSMMGVAFTAPLNGLRVPGGALVDVFLLIAVAALMVDYLRRERPIHPLPSLFARGLCFLAVGGIIGTLFAGNPAASVGNLARFVGAAVGPVVIVLTWRPDLETVERFSWFWLGGALLSCAIALTSAGDVSGRPMGLTTHPNHLAIISSLSAALALAMALYHRGAKRLLAAASLLVLVAATLQSGSRAGVVALAVIIVIIGVQNPAKRNAVAVAGLLVALTSGLLVTGVVDVGKNNGLSRLLGDPTATTSNKERLPVLRANLKRIGDHPLTGDGFAKALEAHNIYVQVWVAAGIIGLVGLVFIGWSTVALGLRAAARGSPVAIGYAAGYLGYLSAGLFQNILWDRYIWIFVAMTVWLGILVMEQSRAEVGCA